MSIELEERAESAPDDDDTLAPDGDGDGETEDGDAERDEGAEPAEPAMLSEREMENAIRKLEREAERHRSRVREIMGGDADSLHACPLCEPAVPGFRWPQQPDYDTQQKVLAELGLAGDAGLVEDDEARECDRCRGRGETLTGSKVGPQRTRPCPKCMAKGWTSGQERSEWDTMQRSHAAAAAVTASFPAAPAAIVDSRPAVDAWGRPLSHPFYGLNPVYMTAAQRDADHPGVA